MTQYSSSSSNRETNIQEGDLVMSFVDLLMENGFVERQCYSRRRPVAEWAGSYEGRSEFSSYGR